MALSATDIATLSRLLDEGLALDAAQHEPWLAALAPEHRRHADTLRDMLRAQAGGNADERFSTLPRLDPDEAVARAGERVGAYRLVREIGRGGMGSVWLAARADGHFKRDVALKLPRLAWGAGLAARMAREREIGALLEHPHIARLYDAGVDERGRPFMAMEYIDGQPIDAWCRDHVLDVRARLRLFVQVVRAVAYAHGRLVIHRDLKPANVMVDAQGQAHLLDFGIARLLHDAAPEDERQTQEQARMLTPCYASPEQLGGETITVASDVYSLGVLLYELLAGRLPYGPTRAGPAALEEAILRGEQPPASSRALDKRVAKALRGELDAILAKALQREPGRRYATADALAEDIERHLNGDAVLARPDSAAYRLRKALRRHRLGFASGGAILLAVLGGIGVSIVQTQRANDAAERAQVVKAFIVDVFKVNERDNPANAEVRQLPAELLLERGARLIETRFSGQPQLQAELYGVVGGIFADMGANELATTYAAKQVETLAATHARPQDQVPAMVLLAQSLFQQGRLSDAQVRARQALDLVDSSPALRQEVLVLLARVLHAQGNKADAARLLDRAVSVDPTPLTPSATRAQAKALQAMWLRSTNGLDEAMPAYQAAIDEALAAEGPLSPTAARIRLSLAHSLALAGRAGESRGYRDAAFSARRATGGAGDIRAALDEANMVAVMFSEGQVSFDDARDTLTASRAGLAARGRLVPEPVKASIDFWLGGVYIDWGQFERAEPLLRSSLATLLPTTEDPLRRFAFATYQGLAAMYTGRHAQADAHFQQRRDLHLLFRDATHPDLASDHVFQALNLAMDQRFEEAERVLALSPNFDAPAAASRPVMSARLSVQRALARVRLGRGAPEQALALLPPEETDTDPQFPTDDFLLRGEVLCAVARHAEGLAWLDKSLKWHEAHDYPHHPELARSRAATGLCALASGQRRRAAELATLARASFAVQPEVSPYFKAPLARLERALGAGSSRPARLPKAGRGLARPAG